MASSAYALPGCPVTDDELHALGFAAHEISLRATNVPLPDGLGCEWITPGDVPDSPEKLADLDKFDRTEKPAWVEIMAKRRRKSLVVCSNCHDTIHAGQPAATLAE